MPAEDTPIENWLQLPDARLLECLLTTTNADGTTNVAAIGPMVDVPPVGQPISKALLRPYKPSATFENLCRTGSAVLHVTDDVELIVRAALNLFDVPPTLTALPGGEGHYLVDTCRWYSLRVVKQDIEQQPALFGCVVEQSERLRDFAGFNRAMHAVIEAAILASRLQFLPPATVADGIAQLAEPVRKTGSHQERQAFALVARYVQENMPEKDIEPDEPSSNEPHPDEALE